MDIDYNHVIECFQEQRISNNYFKKNYQCAALLPVNELLKAFGNWNFDGSILIAVGKNPILQKVGGRDMDQDSQFLVGSISKQFTSAAVLKALYLKTKSFNELKIALQRPVSYYLNPQNPIWDRSMPKWADVVTLHQLLVHQSGIPNFSENIAFEGDYAAKPHSQAELLNLVKKQSLKFKPGSAKEYSNTNYLLLAEVVSALSKQPFDQFLSQQFFKPLQMTSTFQPKSGDLKDLQLSFPRLADGLNEEGKQPARHMDLSNVQGSGALISTIGDLLKWNIALHIENAVLPKSVYTLMVTNYGGDEGYGIGVEVLSSGKIFGQQGRIDTFNSILFYEPEDQTSLIILTNTDKNQEFIINSLEKILGQKQTFNTGL